MLVIDGVELHLFDQPQQVGELHRQHTVVREHPGEAGDEIVEVGHMRQHVVADQQIGGDAFAAQLIGQLAAEKRHPGRHADGFGCFGDVGGWLDAQHRNVRRHEVLQ